jgi:hypothetical protein
MPRAPELTTNTQYGATIVKRIITGKVDDLRALLNNIGEKVDNSTDIPFTTFATLHFMSWFIVDEAGNNGQLFLELNVDGPIKPFLEMLVARAWESVDQIYQSCEGYPAGGSHNASAVVDYLLRDNIGYDCYYIGWRGLSADRIRRERDFRAQIEILLDKIPDATLASMPPADIRKMIQGYVENDPALSWVKKVPPRPFFVRNRPLVFGALKLLGVLVVIGIILGFIFATKPVGLAVLVLVAAVLGFFLVLRQHEKNDKESDAQPVHAHVTIVATNENRIVQNHFASVADVKPGPFRYFLLKTVLKIVHLLAAVSSNQGSLSGITSIHFARWVVINGGKRLLFLSNYDGSWENYLDDFIDRASNGLTAIWSNTIGFPRSRLLVYGGATDEFLFKTLVRRSQVPSLVWYSAYPDLSVQNINCNAAIREGLFAPMDTASELQWLKNF